MTLVLALLGHLPPKPPQCALSRRHQCVSASLYMFALRSLAKPPPAESDDPKNPTNPKAGAISAFALIKSIL